MTMATHDVCPHCGAGGQTTLFCQSCGLYMPDQTRSLERVTFTRRFFGTNWLEGLLFVLTLGVGWLIWLGFTASTAQTPAKRILNVYILDTDTGQPISAGRVWVRDVVVKYLLFSVLNFVVGIASLVDGAWVLFDKNRQALHDKLVNTVVVYAPRGMPAELAPPSAAPPMRSESIADVGTQLRELAKLREDGILTEEEYNKKRAELAGKL